MYINLYLTSYFPYIGNRFPIASIFVSIDIAIFTGALTLLAATAQAVAIRADRPSLLPYPPPTRLTLTLTLKKRTLVSFHLR